MYNLVADPIFTHLSPTRSATIW